MSTMMMMTRAVKFDTPTSKPAVKKTAATSEKAKKGIEERTSIPSMHSDTSTSTESTENEESIRSQELNESQQHQQQQQQQDLQDPTMRTTKKEKTKKKHIHQELCFGNVEVIEFAVIVGDNPEVSDGCPVALDWNVLRSTCLHVTIYENYRSQRRAKDSLRLSVRDRAEM